jgi:succinylglutamate desuccinylase
LVGNNVRILLLGSQHGNEYLGERLFEYIKNSHADLLDNVTFVIANPRARKQRLRYVESDMNRSYTGHSSTYEERRAQKILRLISESDFDVVLDMHTTTTEQTPCLIVASIRPENVRFIQASSIDKIVVMNNPITATTLNGVCPQAISVEINESFTDDILENLCADISRYVENKPSIAEKYAYEVTHLLEKAEITDEEATMLRNFTLSPQGYYPILVGENSYKHQTNYRGFKAYKRYKFKV